MKLGTRVAMKGKPRIQVSSQLAWTLIILLIVQSSALKTGKFMFVWLVSTNILLLLPENICMNSYLLG